VRGSLNIYAILAINAAKYIGNSHDPRAHFTQAECGMRAYITKTLYGDMCLFQGYRQITACSGGDKRHAESRCFQPSFRATQLDRFAGNHGRRMAV